MNAVGTADRDGAAVRRDDGREAAHETAGMTAVGVGDPDDGVLRRRPADEDQVALNFPAAASAACEEAEEAGAAGGSLHAPAFSRFGSNLVASSARLARTRSGA